MAGTDIRYPMGAEAVSHPLVGGFMPNFILSKGSDVQRVAELMRGARHLLLDLAGWSMCQRDGSSALT